MSTEQDAYNLWLDAATQRELLNMPINGKCTAMIFANHFLGTIARKDAKLREKGHFRVTYRFPMNGPKATQPPFGDVVEGR